MDERQMSKEEFLARVEREARSLRRQELALGLASFAAGVAYLAVMLGSGSVRLREFVTRPAASQWEIVAWYLILFTLIYYGVHFPISFVRGYVVQRRFRLSRQRLRRWLWAHAKKIFVSVAMIVLLGEGLYLFLRLFPDRWWLWAWGGYAVFGLLLSGFGSRVLLPLFYKRADLEDDELRGRIEALARRAGVRASGVKRVILGEDTRKANAAVMGLGATKEVLLSDTLLMSLAPEEIEGVVAHELAHLRLRHTEVLFAVGVGVSLAAFALAGWALGAAAGRLSLEGVWDVAGFPLIILVMSGLFLVLTPPLNWLSRRLERSADLWAARFTGKPEALASGLDKLSATNLAERQQPRYHEVLFSSHPSIGRRIAYLKDAAAKS